MDWRGLENDGMDCEAVVVAADIRESTSLMKESVDPTGFARALHEFTTGARADADATEGWFDKFTGDGFIVYWPNLHGKAIEPRVRQALEFCERTERRFPAIFARFEQNSRNLTAGAGLALGLDSGSCRLAVVGTELTIIGTPIVGAVRMVSAARAGELLVNVLVGEALARGFLSWPGLSVARRSVETKDYPRGQVVFSVAFPCP
jgi:class 3 adenylate cyclase